MWTETFIKRYIIQVSVEGEFNGLIYHIRQKCRSINVKESIIGFVFINALSCFIQHTYMLNIIKFVLVGSMRIFLI